MTTEYIVQLRLSVMDRAWQNHCTVTSPSDRIDMLVFDLYNVFVDELKSRGCQMSVIRDLEFRAIESATSQEVVRVGFNRNQSALKVHRS